jgi:hypothetical protein
MKNELTLLGAMFILVILILLSMVSFSVLALMSSAADLRLAQSSSGWTQEYYRLEAQANAKLKQANDILSMSQNGLYTELEDAGWTITGNRAQININADNETGQNIKIVIQFKTAETNPGLNNTGYFTVISWQQWQNKFEYEDEILNIWPGV